MQTDFCVLTDTKDLSIFKLVNAEVYYLDNVDNAEKIFYRVASKYKLIVITESLAKTFESPLKQFEGKIYPNFLILPTTKSDTNYAIKKLVNKTKESIGIDIFKE